MSPRPVVALYYYALIIAEMHFRAPDRPEPIAGGAGYGIALVLTTAGTIVLGVAATTGVALAEMGTLLLR